MQPGSWAQQLHLRRSKLRWPIRFRTLPHSTPICILVHGVAELAHQNSSTLWPEANSLVSTRSSTTILPHCVMSSEPLDMSSGNDSSGWLHTCTCAWHVANPTVL